MAQKLGQLQPFITVFPQECMVGPTCIFWANLTPFSLEVGLASQVEHWQLAWHKVSAATHIEVVQYGNPATLAVGVKVI